MDSKKLVFRYRQFGGFHLVREYVRLGVMPLVLKGFCRCVLERTSFKSIYPPLVKRIEPFLEKKYEPILYDRKEYYKGQKQMRQRNNVIWFCWLQGLENAPKIVKICYESLKIHLSDRTIKVIDSKNWKELIMLPGCIVDKWEKGRIPAANFSDLLRLELLIQYGGTWIDSTVLCTGFNGFKVQEVKRYLDADLFLFQYTPPGTTDGINISNWFISACTNQEVLMVLRDMLFEYWKDYNCTLDYYIFHLFFAMVAKEYPEEVAAMPYGSSQRSITLMHNMGKPFDKEKWDRLIEKVSFHKLSFRVPDEMKNNKGNYYNYILYGLQGQ